MNVTNFLKMHEDGTAQNCISIHQLPYDHSKHGYVKTYFEECSQDEIQESKIFKTIKNKKVDHFNIIGGGMYPYLQKEESD